MSRGYTSGAIGLAFDALRCEMPTKSNGPLVSSGDASLGWGVFSFDGRWLGGWVLRGRADTKQAAEHKKLHLMLEHPETPGGRSYLWSVKNLDDEPRQSPSPVPQVQPIPKTALPAPATKSLPLRIVSCQRSGCGRQFEARRSTAKYCPDRGCRASAFRERSLGDGVRVGWRTCRWCRGIFTPKQSHQKFCTAAHRKKFNNQARVR